MQAEHSKIKCIKYTKLAIQPYLKCSSFTNKECDLLFALRSKSVRGIKANTPSAHRQNIFCPLCGNETNSQDDQEHILKCHKIIEDLKQHYVELVHSLEYTDLYGTTHQQKAAVEIYMELLEVRSRLLEDIKVETSPASGTSLDTATPACQGGGGHV